MRYILKKTGVLVVTLLLVSLLAFLAFQVIPADPVTMLLGTDYTPERADELLVEFQAATRAEEPHVTSRQGEYERPCREAQHHAGDGGCDVREAEERDEE